MNNGRKYNWQIPVFRNRKATIKSLIEISKNTLDNIFKDLGEDKFLPK